MTSRSMHCLRDGGWLIDTPGMRQLQLVDVGDVLDEVFADIADLSKRCKVKDCQHDAEPGCAVQAAMSTSEHDAHCSQHYRKPQAEDRRNSESLADRRSRDKSLGKLYKSIRSDMRGRMGGE